MASQIRGLAQILSIISSQSILPESRSHTANPIQCVPVKSSHIQIVKYENKWSQSELLKCALTSNRDVHISRGI